YQPVLGSRGNRNACTGEISTGQSTRRSWSNGVHALANPRAGSVRATIRIDSHRKPVRTGYAETGISNRESYSGHRLVNARYEWISDPLRCSWRETIVRSQNEVAVIGAVVATRTIIYL